MYFGSVHCDLFGTCPHQNLSSNSWHPLHPVDWMHQGLLTLWYIICQLSDLSGTAHEHHRKSATIIESSLASWRRRLPALQCSYPSYLSISQFGSPFWRFKGQHESGLVSVVIEVGKPGAVKSTALVLQWVSSEDLGTFRRSISHLKKPPCKQTYKKQSKAYKFLRYIETRESWGWDYLLPGWLFQTCTDMYLCTRPYMFDIVRYCMVWWLKHKSILTVWTQNMKTTIKWLTCSHHTVHGRTPSPLGMQEFPPCK